MIIVDDTAVRADRYVNAGLLEVLVARRGDLHDRRGLSAADTLRLTGDADRAAADADLHEIGTRLGEEAEAIAVHDITRADLYGVAVVFADPLDRDTLPLGIAFGTVDAENVRAGVHECGHALGIVTRVDAGADHEALLTVDELEFIALMRSVILPEHEIRETLILIHQRESVQLMIPDHIVRLGKRRVRGGADQLLERRHELLHLHVDGHAADAVVTARDQTQELTVGGSIVGHGDGRVAASFLQLENVRERVVGGNVRITDYETGLIRFYLFDHRGFALDTLGAVDEAHAALGGQGHGHTVVGDGLHDRGDQRDVQGDRRFLAFSELNERGLQADVRRNALRRRIAGNEKILTESVRGFLDKSSHYVVPPVM